uniref:Putative secreted peptide n=1 Tax=Anopheles braziliensis TaxID=58242 RepID=A0A2M3ZQC7_9DIPT
MRGAAFSFVFCSRWSPWNCFCDDDPSGSLGYCVCRDTSHHCAMITDHRLPPHARSEVCTQDGSRRWGFVHLGYDRQLQKSGKHCNENQKWVNVPQHPARSPVHSHKNA